MNITVITQPAFEPITVADVYQHLRWDVEYSGSPLEPFYPLQELVERNIKTAREYVETYTRRALVDQTLRLSASSFVGLELLRPPLIELQSIGYYDDAGVLQTLPDLDDFYVTDDLVPQVRAYSRCSLYLAASRPDAVRMTYRAGYLRMAGSPPAQTGALPSGIKDALLIHVQLLSDRFDADERADLERTRDTLLQQFKIETF